MPDIHSAWFAQIWNLCTIRANKLRIANLHELLSIHYSWIHQIHDLRTHLRTITNNHEPICWHLISRLELKNFQNKSSKLHEQCTEINTSQTNQCKSSSCPLMVRAKTASGCKLTNRKSRIKSGTNRTRITWEYTMHDSWFAPDLSRFMHRV